MKLAFALSLVIVTNAVVVDRSEFRDVVRPIPKTSGGKNPDREKKHYDPPDDLPSHPRKLSEKISADANHPIHKLTISPIAVCHILTVTRPRPRPLDLRRGVGQCVLSGRRR
jgi:hypothetical protein